MTQLSIEQIIKMIIAVLIIIVVVFGVYLGFKNYIIPYFKNINFNETSKLLLVLIN